MIRMIFLVRRANPFADDCELDDEKKWVLFKAFATQSQIQAVAGRLSSKEQFLLKKLHLSTMTDANKMVPYLAWFRQLTEEVRATEGFTEADERTLTTLLAKLDNKGLYACDPKTEKEWLCLLYTSPSPRDGLLSRMPSSA